RKCQQPFSQEQIDTDFLAIESFYDGQGWYFDGRQEKRDYYIAFAFHFYSLLYYKEKQKQNSNHVFLDTHQNTTLARHKKRDYYILLLLFIFIVCFIIKKCKR